MEILIQMIKVVLNNIDWSFNKERNTIIISEKSVKFGTEYEIVSPKGNSRVFTFTHSTGPEFDKDTRWVYMSDDGVVLEVCNDEKMVKVAAKQYLDGKLN
jgi:hypothetical protein